MSGATNEQAQAAQVTILLVDDEFDVRFVAKLLLEDAGHRVVEAFNGQDALDRLADEDVDLVVTDTDMPGMDGAALVASLRAADGTARLPILAWGEREPSGLDVDATLAKGAGIHELAGEVQRLLQRNT